MIEWPAPVPLHPVPLKARFPVLVVEVFAVPTAPAVDSPGAAKVTVDETAQLMAGAAFEADAEAIPPLTTTTLAGMAIAAATTINFRNMYCSLFSHVSMGSKSGDLCPPTCIRAGTAREPRAGFKSPS